MDILHALQQKIDRFPLDKLKKSDAIRGMYETLMYAKAKGVSYKQMAETLAETGFKISHITLSRYLQREKRAREARGEADLRDIRQHIKCTIAHSRETMAEQPVARQPVKQIDSFEAELERQNALTNRFAPRINK